MTNDFDSTSNENLAVDEIEAEIKGFIESQPIGLILDTHGFLDTPQEFWSISRALQRLADLYSDLATR